MIHRVLLVVLACALSTAGAGASDDLPRPTTRDYAACLDENEHRVCLLDLSTRGNLRPLSQHSGLAQHPEVVEAIHVRRGIVPSTAPNAPRDALGEPLRLQLAAIDAAQALVDDGAAPDVALEPIAQTARGVGSRDLMFGQIHMDSGAEIRAKAYATLVRRYFDHNVDALHTQPSREVAEAALAGWENELRHSRDFSEYHNPSITPRVLFRLYARIGDEAGARRAYQLAHGSRLTLSDEVRILLALGRAEAAQARVDAYQPRRRSEREDLETARRSLISDALNAPQETVRNWAFRAHAEQCETLPPLSLQQIENTAPAGDEAALRGLAECYDGLARTFDAPASGYAISAFALWERLGETSRADALMTIWHGYYVEEIALGACPGQRALCAYNAYNIMLGRRDRIVEAFERPGFDIRSALEIDIRNGRGLQNFEAFVPFATQPFNVEFALTGCVELTSRGRSPDMELAEACTRRLLETAAARQRTEHELSREEMDPLTPPRRSAGPYHAAETALIMGGAAAREGDQELAGEMLETALTIWSEQADARPPIIASRWIKTIVIAQLDADTGARPKRLERRKCLGCCRFRGQALKLS